MIDSQAIASAINVPCIVSSEMLAMQEKWEQMYFNRADWHKGRVKSLRIPSAGCKELKRLTLKEFTATVDDAELDAALGNVITVLRKKLEMGIAMGGLLFKPYWSANGIRVDIVTQGCYLPITYTDDSCTAVACAECITIGEHVYTRVEHHSYDQLRRQHTIINRCFHSKSAVFIGTECALTDVPQWADIVPIRIYERVDRPLFAMFQMPNANTVDPESPLGISAFADAVDRIREADQHWERILWELESSERAIDASEDLFRFNLQTKKPELPKGRERMFRTLKSDPNAGTNIFNTFSPEVRDTSYFNALNQILRRIEDSMGLSYGTLSQVSDVEKTAEEVRASKDRSFSSVQDIQETLRAALEHLVYVMQYYRDTYRNQKLPQASLTCTFGDGVREDPDKEYARRMQMVTSGVLSKEQFLMWYFSCDEETARAMMPKNEPLFGGDLNADTIGI